MVITKVKQNRSLAYSLLIIFVTVIGTFAISVIWANRAADSAREDADRAFIETQEALCVLINDIYNGQQEEPPQGESGKEFAERISDLRKRFECA